MIAHLTPTYLQTRPLKALTRLMSATLFEGRPLTAKGGTLIHPLVFAVLQRLATARHRYPPPLKPIFIVGIGRSGSTILGNVLSLHKDVGYLNEPKALWHCIYPHEDIIGTYTAGAAHYRLTAEAATETRRAHATQLFGGYLHLTRSKRLVDKYPELIFRTEFVQALFPEARFLLLVRNGWDTCHSIATWSQHHGRTVAGHRHDWWGVDDRKWHLLVDQLVTSDPALSALEVAFHKVDRHLDRAVVEWILTLRQGLRLLHTAENVHLVRFERLTHAPDETLSALCDFCELPPDETFSAYARQTLHPVPAKPRFDVHPKLKPIFEETLTALGYPH